MALVTYSFPRRAELTESGFVNKVVDLALGDGSTAYPAGGIPLSLAQMGFRVELRKVVVMNDAGSTRLYKWDIANSKLRIFVETAGTYAEMSGTVPSITLELFIEGY